VNADFRSDRPDRLGRTVESFYHSAKISCLCEVAISAGNFAVGPGNVPDKAYGHCAAVVRRVINLI